MNKLFYAILLSCLVSACSTVVDQGQFTIISNKNVDLSNVDITLKNRIQNVRGESSNWDGFLTQNYPSLEEAMDKALDKTTADLMLNVRAKTYLNNYIFFATSGWIVEGDAVKTRKY